MKEKITQYEENKVEEHFLELIQRYTGEMIQRANRELSINVQEAYAEYLGRQDQNIKEKFVELYLKEWQ